MKWSLSPKSEVRVMVGMGAKPFASPRLKFSGPTKYQV
jgi:hypothetical protein